ncbi:helix-turn-helix transcriptional regulator [Candidatus Woesearchaeota archaeon]|nr:helix-turn-helix transcriptional regulator [Candidatus Woesearchaeota archaeon]
MRVTILRIEKPRNEINEEIQWLCQSLGLFGERDKEKSCYRVFLELLKNHKGLTSDEIAQSTHITRGTVIHHISKLSEEGLIINQKNMYKLRTKTLYRLIKELETDIEETFQEMEKIAKKIDKRLE